MSKVEDTFNISEVFKYFTFGQVVLHYIHQENLWLEQKWVNRGNFSAGGKLRMQKLCRNKHFSTAGTISPNSKRKTFSCSPSIIFFNHKLGLFEKVFAFPYLGVFPGSPVILLWSALPASQLEISNVALIILKSIIISMTYFVCNSKAGVQVWNQEADVSIFWNLANCNSVHTNGWL